ncbi:MAG: SpoIVB peptidase [Clostridia bacterium]|nr:SpoIVB peptidase [Clostridia bacterium]
MRKIKEKTCHSARSARSLVALVLLACMFLLGIPVSARENKNARQVLLGGELFGTRIRSDGVLVVGVACVVGDDGERCPAKEAGILPKDIIKKINGNKLSGTEDLVNIIEQSGGEKLTVTLMRDGKEMSVTLVATKDKSGEYKGGLWVRDSIAGIGTVSFIDPETGNFAGLGHGICDPDTGVLIPVKEGSVYGVILSDVKKGSSGKPGELRGRLDGEIKGRVSKNDQSGVYGNLSALPEDARTVDVAFKNEVKTGKASVVCSLDGEASEYEAYIEKIISADGAVKNFLIKITDRRLLALTGGIVQGMSGSPIIQDGKLVGAVTHVLIDDPTKGYGIFAENMLETARSVANKELKKVS